MTLFVKFEGISEAVGTLRRLPAGLEKTTINRMSQVAYDEAQRGAGRHNKTGSLFQSLFNRPIPNGREIGHDPKRAPHAIFVQLGTRPHEIRGTPITPYKVYAKPPNKVLGGILRPWYLKTQKTLRWSGGGKFFFANSVKHPGYIGDGYLFNAATLAVREFASIVDKALKEQT